MKPDKNEQARDPGPKTPDHRLLFDYLNRKLPVEKEREIEAYLDRHPELWDAVEGWMGLSATHRRRAQKRLSRRLQQIRTGRGRRRRLPLNRNLEISGWVALLLLLALVAWGFLYYLFYSGA